MTKMKDTEFEPVTEEDIAREAREAELARKIRREVLCVQRGDADEDIRQDEEQEQEQEQMRQQAEEREKRRQSSALWMLFTGSILVKRGVSAYYGYMITIAVMFFVSIVVLFSTLRLDIRYSRLERDVQMLRERSIRLQEQRFRQTSHSAIVELLKERGIELYDPLAPSEVIDQ